MSTNTMRISTDNYEKFKNIMHPNLRHNIKRYLHNDFMKFHFITDVIKKNRNGTTKRIDYKRGEICVLPNNRHLWKPYENIKFKHLPSKIYLARYMSNIGLNSLANYDMIGSIIVANQNLNGLETKNEIIRN